MSGEDKKVTEITLEELRQIITGQSEFVFKINDKIDMTFRELSQMEMSEIDKLITAKNIPSMSSEYVQQLGIAKLSRALKSIRVNGEEYPTIGDANKIQELIGGLGESVVTGLILAYEGEISNKFRQIEKKN